VPAELAGTLYRTGPALFASGGRRYQHLFDGDGAVSAVRFAGGTVLGAARLVDSAGLRDERRAGRMRYGTYGTNAPGWRRVLPRLKNSGNTAMLAWAGRLFALFEPARPTEIDADSLATRGETDLGGVIPQAFSAHPHAVAARRTIVNFGVRYGRRTVADLFALEPDGRARRLGEVALPGPTMIHDFAVTERHAVFFVSPLRFNPARVLLGLESFGDALRWRPELGTEIIVAPLADPAAATRFTVEPFFQWHFANAFERGGEIVVDVVRWPDFSSNAWLKSLVHATHTTPRFGDVARATLQPGARRARFERLWSGAGEFPRVAPAVEGAAYRFVYLASTSPASQRAAAFPDGITRLDVTTGRADTWTSAAGEAVSEAVFVPRPGAADEDAGWLVALAYDPRRDRTAALVLDARAVADGPVARAWFDHHLPPTFHGTFV
jgi:carotenoid cleavage dioxygenase-like enzyme